MRMFISPLTWYFLILLVSGCTTVPLMQESYYNQISPGVEINEIETLYGEAYEIRQQQNEIQEYVYVQRVELGRSAVDQLEFIYLVRQGKVIGKKCQHTSTSGIQITQ